MRSRLEAESAARACFAAQHGVATRRQLLVSGLSPKAIRHRLASGRLVARYAGVYGHPAAPRTRRQDVCAAVLAGGETAFASHETAAWLWGVRDEPEHALIEVTTVLERVADHPGVWAHRSGLLVDADIRTVDGIPAASMERTVVDLSGRLGAAALGRLVDDAIRRRLTTFGRIAGCLERLPQAPGRSPKTVREVLASRVPGLGLRESELEEFVFDSLRRYEIPLPRMQVWVELPCGRRRLDKCYPDRRLVIEADGFETHGTRSAFDDDRARNNELVVAGYRVLHFTTEFTDHEIAATVARALDRSVPQCASQGPQSFKRWCEGRRAARSSAPVSGARSGR